MDNSGDFVSLVADRRAFARGRRPYPLAARGGCGCIDYQPGYRTARGLRSFTQRRKAKTQRRKRKPSKINVESFPLRLCVFYFAPLRESNLRDNAFKVTIHIMEFREINKTDSNEFQEAMEIYREAFPANERHSVPTIVERVNRGLNQLYVASVDDEIAFLALLWPLKGTNFILLDYIATKATHRGKGIASAFLMTLRSQLINTEKHLIVEVENPRFGDPTQKERRVKFYKRHGAKELEGVRYLLPPLDGSTPTEMLLMIFPEYKGEEISGATIKNVIIQIYRELYSRQEDDALLGTFVHDIANTIKLV